MAIPLTKFMKIGNRPRLNEFSYSSSRNNNNSVGFSNKLQAKRKFWTWFRSRPELNSPVTIRVNDTITHMDFYDLDGKALGPRKLQEAQEDYAKNFMTERLKSIWSDALVTGDGFAWKGFQDPAKLKEIVDEFSSKYDKMYSVKEGEDVLSFAVKKLMDEDSRKPRKFDHIASSMMQINHSDVDVIGYTQFHNGGNTTFSKDEIIHFKFMSVDGKVAGYTPIESLFTEMILLYFIKENMVSYIRNGGVPRKIFTLEDELPGSQTHNFLTELLMSQGALENRHGNLVLTGKVDVKDMEEKLRDMEYKDLALYVTSNIAYALQIPVSRIPYMIGQAQSGGDAGGLAESGYWSMIDSDQLKIENLMNTQYFEAKSYMGKFRRHYKIDDLREVQALGMKADAITKMQTVFSTYGKELSVAKITTLMDLNSNDVVDIPKDRVNPLLPKTNLLNQNQLSNGELDNPDKQKKNDTKRQAALNNSSGADQSGQ